MPRLRWRSGLYAITDTLQFQNDALIDVCHAAIRGGIVVLQYRDKSKNKARRLWEAQQLKALCKKNNVAFIINDDIELCLAVDADGVHIGKDDLALETARQRLGAAKIIGVSCYNSLEKARYAMQHSANYIAFGAFYASLTKPNAPLANKQTLREAQMLGVPIVAIGGIQLDNANELIRNGAHNLAVINDLWSAENIEHQASAYQALLKNVQLPNFEQGY